MSEILYPDNGEPFEDAAVLRNAVHFSTAARAHSAQLILQQSLGISQRELNFLAVKAFAEFMTSTEDMLGWLFALKDWQPGNAEFSLLLLLNDIKVGYQNEKRGVDYTEVYAEKLLSNLSEQGFRELIHIPNHGDLVSSGMSIEKSKSITRSMPFKFEGWRKIVSSRSEQDRSRVRAFNKLKHHMLAFPTQARNKDEVLLPSRITFQKSKNRILMETAWLEVSSNQVRRWAGDAIAAQAVLHDTLALILVVRYGVNYNTPPWVYKAYETDYLWKR
jgi:hypothetical protein